MRYLVAVLFLAAALSAPIAGGAQSDPRYVPLGPATGALYRPDGGAVPHVAVLVAHRTANYLNHPACTELSRRGYLVLCMNTRYVNNEELVRFEEMALDIKAGVGYLRRQAGITKVVLFAHSGGGPTMSFYQAVAEHGVAYCQLPERLVRCDDSLAGLPPADGIVFADAHPGNPVVVLRGLNPAVVDESDPPSMRVDSSLDPFDTKNGFNPTGASHYSADFQRRYYVAQSKRMNALIATSLAKLQAMKDRAYGFPDDDLVVIPRGGNPGAGPGASASLYVYDPDIPAINRTQRPEKLLRNDGSVERRVIDSVFVANPALRDLHYTFGGGTKVLSIRSFLSANATRSTDSLGGIDDCSSNNSTVCAVRSIAVPELFTAMGGHYFIRDVEREYDGAVAKDKDYIVIEGATHGFTPCVPCEKTPGQYSNTMKNLFDYVATWLGKRF